MALPLPATYNLPDIYLGDTVTLDQFVVNDADVDFTGCAIKCAFKRFNNSRQSVDGYVSRLFDSTDLTLTIDTATDGSVSFTIPPFRWTAPAGIYKYDIEILANNTYATYLAGTLTVTEDVTKWQ